MHLFHRLSHMPLLLLSLAALMWGGNAVAGKFALDNVSPFLHTTLRWVLAVGVLTPFALPHVKRDWPVLRPKLIYLLLMGMIGFTLFNAMFYSAALYTSAINIAILQAAVPLIVFILNFLIFKAGVSTRQMGGYLLTLFGVIAIATQGDLAKLSETNFNPGDIIMLAAGCSYALYSVLLRNKPQTHWLSLFYIMTLGALATSLPFTGFEAWRGNLVLSGGGIAVLLYTGIFPSIFAQIFWIRGIELTGANRGGLFINLVPVFGTLLAIFLLGERLELYHLTALVLVIVGVLIAQSVSFQSVSSVVSGKHKK